MTINDYSFKNYLLLFVESVRIVIDLQYALNRRKKES